MVAPRLTKDDEMLGGNETSGHLVILTLTTLVKVKVTAGKNFSLELLYLGMMPYSKVIELYFALLVGVLDFP